MYIIFKEVVVGRWVAPEGNAYGVPVGTWSWGVWPLAPDSVWGAYRSFLSSLMRPLQRCLTIISANPDVTLILTLTVMPSSLFRLHSPDGTLK